MTKGEPNKETVLLNAEGQYVPTAPVFVFHGSIGTGNPDLYEASEVQPTVQPFLSNQTGECNDE
jgi:hypothetical protein